MSVLVVGRYGQVARALVRAAKERSLDLVRVGRAEVDLEDMHAVSSAVERLRPTLVINAGAYTAVDKAEDDADRAFRVNAFGPEALARAADQIGATIMHLSTDYVFAGDSAKPYTELDEPAPQGVYGASKLEGERRVAAANPRHLIVRTSWVFDSSGANFVRTMLRLAKTRESVSVVNDQRGSPTHALDLARALLDVADKLVVTPTYGVFHCCGAGDTTWAELAAAVFEDARELGGPSADVSPITTLEFPTRAKRPSFSCLDCSKLARVYDVRMPPWRQAVRACVGEIAAHGWRVE